MRSLNTRSDRKAYKKGRHAKIAASYKASRKSFRADSADLGEQLAS